MFRNQEIFRSGPLGGVPRQLKPSFMAKRTSPSDARHISVAGDLEDLVEDKRAGWRASGAKARRRQRRYKTLLTLQLTKRGYGVSDTDDAVEAALD